MDLHKGKIVLFLIMSRFKFPERLCSFFVFQSFRYIFLCEKLLLTQGDFNKYFNVNGYQANPSRTSKKFTRFISSDTFSFSS